MAQNRSHEWHFCTTRLPYGVILAVATALTGCHPFSNGWQDPESCAPGGPPPGAAAGPGILIPVPPPPTSALIPVGDREHMWNTIVDVVDDYFRIDREARVQQIGDTLTEGRIETFPQVGATLLEPHRPDSANLYERTLSTFQQVRRRATIRVTPEAGGDRVEVTVIKEFEDLRQPEQSTAGGATFRHDSAVERPVGLTPPERGGRLWYPVGRDCALECKILADIRECLGGALAPAESPAGYPAPNLPVMPLPPPQRLPSSG